MPGAYLEHAWQIEYEILGRFTAMAICAIDIISYFLQEIH